LSVYFILLLYFWQKSAFGYILGDFFSPTHLVALKTVDKNNKSNQLFYCAPITAASSLSAFSRYCKPQNNSSAARSVLPTTAGAAAASTDPREPATIIGKRAPADTRSKIPSDLFHASANQFEA
jgi:hypothetical protein